MNRVGKERILIITDVYAAMAGSERNITQLMVGIDKSKFELIVACIRAGKLARDMREQGHAVVDLRAAGIYTADGLKNILFLKRMIREKGISLIVSYHEAADFYGLVLAKSCNIPIISSRRDMGHETRLRHSMAYRLFGRSFDAQITVCLAVKQEMIDRGWFPAARIVPIYNGVELDNYGRTGERIDAIKKRIGIRPDHPVVGVVANLQPVKGLHYLIEAIALVQKKHRDVQLIVIGYDSRLPGHSIDDFQALARKSAIGRNVHFLGSRNDVPDLISIFDVAVISSLSEGFSNTILEYMASGKPVVATMVGGNPEAVQHGETGLLVPPGDSPALGEAIGRMLDDKALAERFGAAGRRKAEEMFSLERMIRNYESLFERVLSAKRNKAVFTGDAFGNEPTGVKSL